MIKVQEVFTEWTLAINLISYHRRHLLFKTIKFGDDNAWTTKRNPKIPQKFDNRIHSINNSITNKKNVSKNKHVSNSKTKEYDSDNKDDDFVVKDGVCDKGDSSVNQVLYNDVESDKERDVENVMEENGMKDNDGCDGSHDTENVIPDQNRCNGVNKEDEGKSMQMDNETVIVEEDMSSKEDGSSKNNNVSYANMVKKDEVPKNLNYIPTLITDVGTEVVIFDDMLVQRGSERWNLIVYGQFVGYDMNIHELRYNIKRMWSKFGVAEIDTIKEGHYVFNSDIGMERMEPKKMPVWVKIVNVPLEAWTMEGISALASSLGKPIMMDTMTANMCYKGIGNFEYARVLVEMDAKKEIKSEIEIQYKDKSNNIKGCKKIKVVYDWKPPACSKCKVFGHEVRHYKKGAQGREDGFMHDRCDRDAKGDMQGDPEVRRQEYRKKQVNDNNNVKNKNENVGVKNKWNVKEKEVDEIRRTANKYFVLDSLPDDNDQVLRMLKDRMIVDKFLNKKMQPTLMESRSLSKDMIKYFKDKWEENKQKELNDNSMETEIEDVINISSGSAKAMDDNEAQGLNTLEKQNEVMNLVVSENLQVCVVLETRLKSKKLVKVCDRVFRGWEWTSNMQECSKGCRIVIGWNDDTNIQVLHKTDQSIFCTISSAKYNVKCFYSFVYAENDGSVRTDLWRELCREKKFVNGKPWSIAGDMNVTLQPNEHSCGSSMMNSDMMEFKDSKVGVMTGILKKLDRVISNEDFINQYPQANAKFSNYVTDKQEFIPIVKEKWNQNIQGFYMYQVVKKLKSLKAPLNKLGCSKGNVFKRVEDLRLKLKDVQTDEEKLLYQQAKINWLSDGDKNSRFFHSVLKGRKCKSKVHSITDKDGIRHEEAEKMISKVSDKEIKESLFDIDDSKASSPDGFLAAFFKKSWSVIGADICKAVKEFFKSRKMLGELNATLISLIPKVQTPNKVTDFRPIACCNVLYKCISKVLTNRIKPILGKLERGPKRVAFKIDIQKAYDTINWKFLEKILGGFGFHRSMIKCVTTVALTLNINGERIGYFKDDLLVMCHGDPTSVKVIKKALDNFSAYSGIFPNNSKSTVFFGSMKEEEKNAISFVLPFAIGKLPVRYLGVPLIAKRLGVKECGRLQLIAAVLESIHVYWASVFLLPTTIIKEINRILENFLWNQSEKLLVRLRLLGAPFAGLRTGFKEFAYMESCLLTKHVWNIATKKDSLWVKWVHSVKLRGKSIWVVKVDNDDSWGWENLLEIRDQIKENVIYKDRLITQDKLSKWGNQAVNRCCLCLNDSEDLKHLFFQCPFAKAVWRKALNMTEIEVFEHEWEGIIQTLINAERNRRIFQDKKLNADDIFKRIVDVVKSKISGLTVKDSYAIKKMEDKWKISCKRHPMKIADKESCTPV
ncbi:RNA-directed DNA polymerase, eukaryota, reverse transcriptase zinc-binding domain protein [Tanacetum coccineum]